MKRPVKRGIEGQIPPADLLVHDGPNLPRPSIGRISAALPADFVREADSYGPVPLRRNAHAGTDVAADIIPALTVLSGSKNVKAGLEPVIEAMSDLDGFVQLVVRGKRAVIGGFGTLKREIGMQLHHSVARLHGFVRVHLDFVVPLRVGRQRQGRAHKQTKCDPDCNPPAHIQFP